jgi:hypothetical protein
VAAIIEVLLQFLFELVLQVVIELLGELGMRSLAEVFGRRPPPVLAAIGYALFGALAGLVSLLVVPQLMIHGRAAQVAGLLLTPVLAGFLMCLVGAWRARRGQAIVRLDRFAYGYTFALALALVRFAFGS